MSSEVVEDLFILAKSDTALAMVGGIPRHDGDGPRQSTGYPLWVIGECSGCRLNSPWGRGAICWQRLNSPYGADGALKRDVRSRDRSEFGPLASRCRAMGVSASQSIDVQYDRDQYRTGQQIHAKRT